MVIYVSGLQIGSEGITKVVEESVDVWTSFSIHILSVCVAVENFMLYYFKVRQGCCKSQV